MQAERAFTDLHALVVDDNAAYRKAFGLILESLGVTVDVALDGSEALKAAELIAYDLILMDVSMPTLDGLSATKLIRRHEEHEQRPRAPLFIVTSHDEPADREAAFEAGADGHIPKPVALNEIVAAAEYALHTVVDFVRDGDQPAAANQRSL